MKHTNIIRSIFAAFVLLSVCAWADKWADPDTGYTWTYQIKGDVSEVSSGDEWSAAVSPKPTGVVIIPSTLGGKPVTGIGHSAFRNCSSLVNVAFPNSILSIGDRSFQDCSSLANVAIPSGILELGNCAFEGCISILSVDIPDSVTSIGGSAFRGCSSLSHVALPQVAIEQGMGRLFPDAYQTITSVSLSDNVVRIPSDAFNGCNEAIYDMTTIPGVKLVDGWAVGYVDGLSGVLDLTGVRGIASSAFKDCELLTHVKIPATVKVIGENAFSGCRGLRSVEIPASVTHIENDAFFNCDGLQAVVVADTGAWCRISFANDSANPLRYAHNLYCGDALVREITVPFGTKEVNDYLFHGCSCLTNVALPRGVGRIGRSAFDGCGGLTEITVPSSVTNVGEYAFSRCEELSRVNAGNLADWCAIDFGNTEANPLSRARHLYVGGNLMTSLVVPWDVARIGSYAFSGCEDMVYAVVSAQVTDVGPCAFQNCCNLKWVYLQGNGDSFAVAPDIYSGTSEALTTFVPSGSTGWLFAGSTTLPCEWPSGNAARTIAHGIWNPETPPRTVTFVGNLESLFEGYDVIPVTRTVLNGSTVEDIPNYEDFYKKYYTWNSWEIDGSMWAKLEDDAYYAFKGWWSAAVGGREITTNTLINSDMACYAHWLKFYHVGFYPNKGDEDYWVGTVIVTNGMALGNCPTVYREGYDFAGWWTAPDGGVQVTESTIVRSSRSYYAHWTPKGGSGDDDEPLDIVAPYAAAKAVVLSGVVYDGCNIAGIVELKLGKVNAQRKTCRVSARVTTLDGKRHTARAVSVGGIDGTSPVAVSLDVKGLGILSVTIGGARFAGSLGGRHVQSANVGGGWKSGTAVATVELDDWTSSPQVLKDLLPTNEVAAVVGGRWKFARASTVKWAKPRRGATLPEIYDEASGKGLIVDVSKGKTNLSGLKLVYTPRKGTFKGSFKLYALERSGKATRLKKYTAKVNGFVVDGVGRGLATFSRGCGVVTSPVIVK